MSKPLTAKALKLVKRKQMSSLERILDLDLPVCRSGGRRRLDLNEGEH